MLPEAKGTRLGDLVGALLALISLGSECLWGGGKALAKQKEADASQAGRSNAGWARE